MKLKVLFLALAVAGAGASFALADDGHQQGGTTATTTTSEHHESTTTTTSDHHESTTTNTTTTGDCRRFELHGTFASVSASSFTVAVKKGNDAVSGVVGTTVTLAVTADTRVSWSGKGTLTGPNTGDTVKVNGKQCGGSAGALTALRVEARGPKTHGQDLRPLDAGARLLGAGHPRATLRFRRRIRLRRRLRRS
jgi:hypothetical protein